MLGDLPYSEDATHLGFMHLHAFFKNYFDFSSFITASVRALTFHLTFRDTYTHTSISILIIYY